MPMGETESQLLISSMYAIEAAVEVIRSLKDIAYVNTELNTISRAVDAIKIRNSSVLFEALYKEKL